MADAVGSMVGEISLTIEGEWLIFKCKAITETGLLVSCLDAYQTDIPDFIGKIPSQMLTSAGLVHLIVTPVKFTSL